jgi:hypothetical protein
MDDPKKPFEFGARVGGKPFKVRLNLPRGHVVTGLSDKNDYYWRFTRPVPVKEGDIFSAAPGKGLILNGRLVPRNFMPKKRYDIKMGWVSEKLRVAVFSDRDEIWNRRTKKPTGRFGKPYWCALDVRSYWIGTGDTVQVALKRLIESVQLTEEMHKEETKKGRRVIRWHVERTPGTRKELNACEEKARKNGFILDGVEWRKARFAKKMVEA